MRGSVIRRGVVVATDVGLGNQSGKALEGEGVPATVIKNELGGIRRRCPLGWMQGGGTSGVGEWLRRGVGSGGRVRSR